MKQVSTIAVGALCASLLAVPPMWARVKPTVYTAVNSYSGSGKHPSDGQVGLLIERSATGSHYACVIYTLITDRKIKGRVSVKAEQFTSAGTRVLQSLNELVVETVELGGPYVDPCTGEVIEVPTLDSNYGLLAECGFFTASLGAGDVVRWTFEFEKMSRLKGDFPLFQVVGQIIPASSGLTAREARSALLREWKRHLN